VSLKRDIGWEKDLYRMHCEAVAALGMMWVETLLYITWESDGKVLDMGVLGSV